MWRLLIHKYVNFICNQWLYFLITLGTFKLKKTEYRKESFNPSQTSDNMYFLDSKAGEYRLIDEEVYNQICSGKIRF